MTEARIIVDSCCELPEEQRGRVLVAPLKVTVKGEHEYIDDGTVDIPALIADMASTEAPARSACPAPDTYLDLMGDAPVCFIITLSSKLSGSYNAAEVARSMALEKDPERKIHVFDSESASAGEVSLLLLLQSLLSQDKTYEEIIQCMNARIEQMHTLFVLDDLGNLMKNGRMGKLTGKLASVLSIRPLLSDDGHGEIKMMAMARGMKNALRSLVAHVAEFTGEAPSRSVDLVLTFCNCPQRAEELKKSLLEGCSALRNVIMLPTGALSSMYANDGGVIVAF